MRRNIGTSRIIQIAGKTAASLCRFIFMGSIILFAVVSAASSTVAFAQMQNRAVTGKTVYIVDGKIVTQQYMNALPVDKIANMEVITNIEKAIVVKTNDPSAPTNNVESVRFVDINKVKTSDGNVIKIIADDKAGNMSKSFNGTITVKGSAYTNPAKDGSAQPLYLIKSHTGHIGVGTHRMISVQQIESMVVLKGKQTNAYKKYGDVSNGVVLVTLKPFKH